ncbi:MAG: TIM barrel protein, partial [Candidatus Sumerlaeota bacterium]|nr:TIM barrel protein [Candidatus Sumerlaeota bacterium]
MSFTRRELIRTGMAAAAVAVWRPRVAFAKSKETPAMGQMQLGLVTYNLAKDWDLETIIKNCEATGFQCVELRTTHAHKVEPDLDAAQRADVRKRFEQSKVALFGLGTTCEFHSPDPAVVRQNIETCRQFIQLAADVGARAVKVRPNGLRKDVPKEKTIEQIGKALAECAAIGAEAGICVTMEVHG